uniref:Uncharacterized protein n=1 Tax=Rhizophora mucronata TaxID=61149 RepID=A0A2P2Q7Z6_RHIMU
MACQFFHVVAHESIHVIPLHDSDVYICSDLFLAHNVCLKCKESY